MSPSAQQEHGILVLGVPKETQKEYDQLAKEFKLKMVDANTREEFIAAVKSAAEEGGYDAVMFPFGAQKGPVNEELLGPLKGQLKFVTGIGAGYDTVDTKWLESVGAWYCNTPESVSDTTATTAVTLILICLRHATSLMASTKAGKWKGNNVLTPDARGFVVGILGMGSIGKLVRNKVQALGMKVIYNNRAPLPAAEEGGATYVSFDDLLSQSNLITVHCPLNPATRHLLGAPEFAKMQDGAMIVNTSRGSVIDEKALCDALRSEKLSRVGLDVFEEEPKIQPYLLECERAALFPHHGSATVRLRVDTELEGISNFRDWVANGKPKNGVNDPLNKSTL
ncbi:hypothetical protein DACRYDRAFT_116306 [Dacryopinax primogenitus]|uniref:2-hydroxyacid dehydrogenase n=1 Tax=Dacryopinax primogenitus (strain DJM 731) TaxID=1858805 RepID=M5G7L8_DACPD|nr:uncharacterized protein DACRYDRAFT_116306 [Dacryopinax primogenitus]EJU01877.1 hypothetical protein DACRYDRAFT_116306 [Dacryopinax primogenitus]